MTELEVRREIIYTIDESNFNGKPIRERLEDGGMDVECLASILAIALNKNLLKLGGDN